MNAALKCSILLNLALAGGLIYALVDRPHLSATAASPRIVETHPPANEMVTATPTFSSNLEPKLEPKAFHWNQLDAEDYHVYVKNLRDIGCPEATVRAIVSADVHAAYNIRYQELEKKLTDLGNGSWSALASDINSEAKLKSELQNLPDAEAAEIADLLGLKPAAPVADNAMAHVQRVQPITLPLALQPIDPTALNLTSEQLKVINDVRQNFMDEVGGANQDPNDPAYLKRWQQAQPEADGMLRGMLGNAFYQNYQGAALQNSQNLTATQP